MMISTSKNTEKFISASKPYPSEPPPLNHFPRPKQQRTPFKTARQRGEASFSHLKANSKKTNTTVSGDMSVGVLQTIISDLELVTPDLDGEYPDLAVVTQSEPGSLGWKSPDPMIKSPGQMVWLVPLRGAVDRVEVMYGLVLLELAGPTWPASEWFLAKERPPPRPPPPESPPSTTHSSVISLMFLIVILMFYCISGLLLDWLCSICGYWCWCLIVGFGTVAFWMFGFGDCYLRLEEKFFSLVDYCSGIAVGCTTTCSSVIPTSLEPLALILDSDTSGDRFVKGFADCQVKPIISTLALTTIDQLENCVLAQSEFCQILDTIGVPASAIC